MIPAHAANDAIDILIGYADGNPELQKKLENAKEVIKNIEYMITSEKFDKLFTWIEQNIFSWAGGYTGISGLFYKNDEPWSGMSEEWNNWLRGPDGVAAELCKAKVLEDFTTDAGFATSYDIGGPYATIESERITIINYTDPSSSPSNLFYYKISFEVYPGTPALGCDLKFKTYLQEKGKDKPDVPLIVDDSGNVYVWDLKRGNDIISYTGSDMLIIPTTGIPTTKEYTKACIYFDEIVPRRARSCLIGIDKGDYLCSVIKEGAQKEYNLDCPSCNTWLAQLFSWGGGGKSTSESETSQGEPNINQNI